MFNKIGKTIRKIHRDLTPVFVVFTILAMTVFKTVPVVNMIQKVLMLTLAATGTYLYVQIQYNKNKSKKRKQASK